MTIFGMWYLGFVRFTNQVICSFLCVTPQEMCIVPKVLNWRNDACIQNFSRIFVLSLVPLYPPLSKQKPTLCLCFVWVVSAWWTQALTDNASKLRLTNSFPSYSAVFETRSKCVYNSSPEPIPSISWNIRQNVQFSSCFLSPCVFFFCSCQLIFYKSINIWLLHGKDCSFLCHKEIQKCNS